MIYRNLILTSLFLVALSCSDSTPGQGIAPDAATDGGDDKETGDSTDVDVATPDVSSSEDVSTSEDATTDFDPSAPFGGTRPATVILPSDYTETKTYPLVTLLHGYTASSSFQDNYFDMSDYVDERQFILILPDGLSDTLGSQFWNATPYCCGTGDRPDDATYLMGLVSEAEARFTVDSKAVYFIGHSNGGFMSYTLACEHGDRIAGIASLAGSSFVTDAECIETGDVAILQIHGTLDAVVTYNGGSNYPGAESLVGRWANRNGCDGGSVRGNDINLGSLLLGDETEVERWVNCDTESADVTLWKMVGATHIPSINDDFTPLMLDHLFARRKP